MLLSFIEYLAVLYLCFSFPKSFFHPRKLLDLYHYYYLFCLLFLLRQGLTKCSMQTSNSWPSWLSVWGPALQAYASIPDSKFLQHQLAIIHTEWVKRQDMTGYAKVTMLLLVRSCGPRLSPQSNAIEKPTFKSDLKDWGHAVFLMKLLWWLSKSIVIRAAPILLGSAYMTQDMAIWHIFPSHQECVPTRCPHYF